jgi:hypothetical protein
MAEATVTTQVHQPFNAHGNFTTEITLNHKLGDRVTDLLNLGLTEAFYLYGRSKPNLVANVGSS